MKKIKVLIVEEDRFLLKLYTDKLLSSDFEVVPALTGEEALHKLAVEKPDFIILDMILPGKSGFDVLAEIKLDPKIKDIPVLIMSNLGQDSDINKGMELGAVDYIVKTDLSIKKLPDIIREHLAIEKLKEK